MNKKKLLRDFAGLGHPSRANIYRTHNALNHDNPTQKAENFRFERRRSFLHCEFWSVSRIVMRKYCFAARLHLVMLTDPILHIYAEMRMFNISTTWMIFCVTAWQNPKDPERVNVHVTYANETEHRENEYQINMRKSHWGMRCVLSILSTYLR